MIKDYEAKREIEKLEKVLNELRKAGKNSKDAEKYFKLAKSFMTYGLYGKAFKFAVKGRIALAKEWAS